MKLCEEEGHVLAPNHTNLERQITKEELERRRACQRGTSTTGGKKRGRESFETVPVESTPHPLSSSRSCSDLLVRVPASVDARVTAATDNRDLCSFVRRGRDYRPRLGPSVRF